MMAYIDTKYLFECETCRHHLSGKCNTWCDHGEEYIPVMTKIPTADVEEIIRCKECLKAQETGERWGEQYKYFCKRHHSFVLEGDFCGYGERRNT